MLRDEMADYIKNETENSKVYYLSEMRKNQTFQMMQLVYDRLKAISHALTNDELDCVGVDRAWTHIVEAYKCLEKEL